MTDAAAPFVNWIVRAFSLFFKKFLLLFFFADATPLVISTTLVARGYVLVLASLVALDAFPGSATPLVVAHTLTQLPPLLFIFYDRPATSGVAVDVVIRRQAKRSVSEGVASAVAKNLKIYRGAKNATPYLRPRHDAIYRRFSVAYA